MVCGAAAIISAAIIGSGTELVSPPIASAGPKPTASVEGAADKDTAWKWFQQKITGPYTAMDDALKTWSTAMGAGDYETMHASCGQIRQAGARFADILPAPDSRANFRLQGVADDLTSAADRCSTLPPGTNWDTAAGMTDYINSAQARLKDAKSIMQPNG